MIHEYVSKYIKLYEDKKIKLNNERIMLIKLLKSTIFPKIESGELYFDDVQINQCVKFIERWFFELKEFQKFLIAFIFLKEKNGHAYYDEFLIMMGRGAGKNGFISGLSHYLSSELHGIDNYDVSIVANNEKQAKTSFFEIYNTIDRNEVLQRAFRFTKTEIESRGTKSIIRYQTSNANTKDGGREGAIIFDEIHRYENSQMVDTMTQGLGKVKHPRTFYIGTDGTLRDGYLDTMKRIAINVLEGQAPDSRLFPFICKLNDEKEVFDESNWSMSNPMFEMELSDYAETLLRRIRTEFRKFDYDSTSRSEFMTKRMNLPEEDFDKIVAKWEDIKAANRPMPLLNNRTAIVGIDYANTTDFASVGFMFKVDNDIVWYQHSFARREVIEKVSFGPDMDEWEKKGFLTIIDEPTIEPHLIADWVHDTALKYNIRIHKIMTDRFRYDLIKLGFDKYNLTEKIERLLSTESVYAQVSPRVELMFNNRQIIFGDDEMMPWYTNNVLVRIKKDGNKTYEKKDPVRRKTDGFHAMIAALFRVDEVSNRDVKKDMDWMEQMLGM